MKKNDKEVIIKRYSDRVQQFGHGVSAIGEPKGRQSYYFDFLLRLEGFDKNDSILDVGCGYGDLFKFLKQQGWSGQYTGVDINKELIEEGRIKYPDADLRVLDLQEEKIDGNYDWCVSAHVLTSSTEDVSYINHLFEMVSIMFELSNKGISFNLLSPLVDYTNPIHARPPIEEIIPLITKLTNRFSVSHDYMPYEYVISCYKNNKINKDLLIFDEYKEHFHKLFSRFNSE